MQSLTPADRVDAIKRAALDAVGGDADAAMDLMANQIADLWRDRQTGFSRRRPLVCPLPKRRADPL